MAILEIAKWLVLFVVSCQIFAMNSIGAELQATMAALDPDAANQLEKLVRDAMASTHPAKIKSAGLDVNGWPAGHFERFAGCLAGEAWDPPADPPPEPITPGT